jgi:hypothetical protein
MSSIEMSSQTHKVGEASSTMTVWMTVTAATADWYMILLNENDSTR